MLEVEAMTPVPKPTTRPKGRKKGLQRTRLKRRRARRIDRESPAERYYKRWIHEQPCYGIPGANPCLYPVEQSHLRDHTGASLKESNFQSIPLCKRMHDSYDGRASWYFKGWTKDERKSWFKQRIADAHKRFEIEHGCKPEEWSANGPVHHKPL